MTDVAKLAEQARAHYTAVCHCEWSDDEYTRTTTSEKCVLHGKVPDPLDALVALVEEQAAEIELLRREAIEAHTDAMRVEAENERLRGLAHENLDIANEHLARAERAEAERDVLREALGAIARNAESWHHDAEAKGRALAIIAKWARNPEMIPEGIRAALAAGGSDE